MYIVDYYCNTIGQSCFQRFPTTWHAQFNIEVLCLVSNVRTTVKCTANRALPCSLAGMHFTFHY